MLGEIHGGGQVEDNMLVAWGKSQGGWFGGWECWGGFSLPGTKKMEPEKKNDHVISRGPYNISINRGYK